MLALQDELRKWRGNLSIISRKKVLMNRFDTTLNYSS